MEAGFLCWLTFTLRERCSSLRSTQHSDSLLRLSHAVPPADTSAATPHVARRTLPPAPQSGIPEFPCPRGQPCAWPMRVSAVFRCFLYGYLFLREGKVAREAGRPTWVVAPGHPPSKVTQACEDRFWRVLGAFPSYFGPQTALLKVRLLQR